MTRSRGSFRRLARSQAVIACTGIFFATLSAHSQSDPAALIPSCVPKDPQAPLAGSSPASVVDSGREQANARIGAATAALQEIRGTSYPELVYVDLRVRTFRSQSDYFRTRFSVSRFLLLMRMRYFVDVNPALFQERPPADGVCAILAHELVHVVSLSRGNRVRRFGLVRLLSKRQTTKFERRADLEAIHRGYGDGLQNYRTWVYIHIPPSKLQEKRRNYFSPEEISAIEKKLLERPDLFAYWSEHVPMNLQAIQNGRK
jgi:hypothetical protein